jgi:hypothetical protein
MKTINGRQYWGKDFGDGPSAQEDAHTPVVPVKTGLVLRYEISKVDGKWQCDCQVHGNPDPADLAEAFTIVQASATKQLAPEVPVVAETKTTEPS